MVLWHFWKRGGALYFDPGIFAYKNERFHLSKLGMLITSPEMCPPEGTYGLSTCASESNLADPATNKDVTVNLRIEGKLKTIFDGLLIIG